MGPTNNLENNDREDKEDREDKVDYGPLLGLLGIWEGDKGLDLSPEPEGSEESPYYESIVFQGVGNAENAESQLLAVLRYTQEVTRKSDNKVFHDQTGYWMWDAEQGIIMQSIVIPRAVCVLAGGTYTNASTEAPEIRFSVGAALDDPDWRIIQSPFMRDKARTIRFRHELILAGKTLSYSETTELEIYGRHFDHTDKNELTLKK